jgi:hypothetical protein
MYELRQIKAFKTKMENGQLWFLEYTTGFQIVRTSPKLEASFPFFIYESDVFRDDAIFQIPEAEYQILVSTKTLEELERICSPWMI